jgi:predicted Zn-dependent protease
MVISAVGCVRTNYNLATNRQERTITSTDREVAMGRKLARRVQSELTLVLEEPLQERIRTIGKRLVAVCDRQELPYQFAVVEDPEVNAFSLPGGYVFVNDGLVKKTANDDELAAVLAHEIAHITARHAVKRYETSLGTQLLQLASLAAAGQTRAAQGLGVAVQAARLAYARQDELEADRLAVRYLKAAGFQASAMLDFLERLDEFHAGGPHYLPRAIRHPQYARSHPYVADRIRAVKEELFGVADYFDYLNAAR